MKCRDGKEYHALSVRNCLAAIWCYLNENLALEELVDILNLKVFYDLSTIVNEKLKILSLAGLGEHNGANGLMITEVEQILVHPIMQHNSPEELLRHVVFYNAILLALRGGEHQDLKISNFVKRFDGGLDVKLYRSKTNQRGLNDHDGQAEMISYLTISILLMIMSFFFTK